MFLNKNDKFNTSYKYCKKVWIVKGKQKWKRIVEFWLSNFRAIAGADCSLKNFSANLFPVSGKRLLSDCECQVPPVRWQIQLTHMRRSRELPGETENPLRRAPAPLERRTWCDSGAFQSSARLSTKSTLDGGYESFFKRTSLRTAHLFVRRIPRWIWTWPMTMTTHSRIVSVEQHYAICTGDKDIFCTKGCVTSFSTAQLFVASQCINDWLSD